MQAANNPIFLFHINKCYFVISIIAAFFTLALCDLYEFSDVAHRGHVHRANVNPCVLVPLQQPVFDNDAWALLSVAVCNHIPSAGLTLRLAVCYIGIMTAALVAEIIFIIVWFAKANSHVQTIKYHLKTHLRLLPS